jgi:hypothetical protein
MEINKFKKVIERINSINNHLNPRLELNFCYSKKFNMSEYTTRQFGAPNSAEYRLWIGKSSS